MFKACFSLPHAPQGPEVDHAYFLLLTLTKQVFFAKFCDKTAGIGSMIQGPMNIGMYLRTDRCGV